MSTIVERIEAVAREIAALSEEVMDEAYAAVENETLKRVAIAAGVDHTMESTLVLEAIGAALQRERDVCREVRRHRDALVRRERERMDEDAKKCAQVTS